jgi:hypothetical protein
VRDDLLEGWLAARAHADEQRGVEPAPVLIAALEVDVRLLRVLRLPGAQSGVRGARVEPDVEDVLLLVERLLAALGTGEACGSQIGGVPLVPGVGPLASEGVGDVTGQR